MKREYYLHLPKAVKKFRSEKYSRDPTSRYALLNADGRIVKCSNTACHAELSYPNGGYGDAKSVAPDKFDPVAVLNQVQELRAGEDVGHRFFEWLLNYSPYRSVFVTKSAKRVLDRNLVVADTEVNANLMVSALMSQRAATENHSGNRNYTIAVTWDRLVSLGVHPSAAFAISHRLRPDDDLTTISPYTRYHTGIGTDDITFWNFLEEVIGNNKGIYREIKTYSGTNAVWKTPRNKTPYIDLTGALNRTKGIANKNNPFAAKPARDSTFPYNEALEEIALTLKNIMKEPALAA